MKKPFASRKFRQGTIATAITVTVLAVIVMLNLVASNLSDRYGLSVDLTSNQAFTLSDSTLEFLDTLEDDIEIHVLNTEQAYTTEGTYFIQAAEVMKKYAQYSPHITLQFVDLVANPGFAYRYSDYDLHQNYVLLDRNGDTRLLDPESFFNLTGDDYGYLYITSSKVEQALTSAMLSLVSTQVTHAALISGHNESQATGLVSLLTLNNYQVSGLSLLSQDISAETDLVIISAPRVDYTEAELSKLDRYLYNEGRYGKTLFYLAAIDQGELPALEAFLAEWGVGVGVGAVFETDYSRIGGNSWFLTIAGPGEHDHDNESETNPSLIHQLETAGELVYMPNARPLEVLGVPALSSTVTTLLAYSQNAGVRTDYDANTVFVPTYDDISGPIPALVLSTRTASGEGNAQSHVLVASTSLAVEESVLAEPVYANSTYFLTLLSTLTNRDEVVLIEAKQIGSTYLGINYGQALLWGTIFFVILPIAVLATGAVVFLSRRHL